MSNEKHYDYYKTTPETKDALVAEYDKDISSKRDAVLTEMQAETGCIAWTERSSWGGATYISQLVYPEGHEILNEPHIKKGKATRFEGEKVIPVSGMGNRKLGKQFDAMIKGYNHRLESLPKYTDWLIEKLGIGRTGIGGRHSSGRGMAMLSTSVGHAGDIIVAMIPNNTDDHHGKVTIPDCLEKITYGEFYDLTND